MDENVTNIEETADEKVNTDTTMNEKAVEAEHMEAEQADPEVEQQDEEAGDSAASYLHWRQISWIWQNSISR